MTLVRDTAAAKSIRAILILKGPRIVAKLQAHFSNAGACTVNLWQMTEAAERSAKVRAKAGNPFKPRQYETPGALQIGKAGGYGYDKLTAALSGMIVDGHEISDHCGGRLKLPRGAVVFPRDFKAPKGYRLSNWCSKSAATGQTVHGYTWTNRAKVALNVTEAALLASTDAGIWDSIRAKAEELETEWRASPDCVQGYSDCYRESGLAYLSAIGYTVCEVL